MICIREWGDGRWELTVAVFSKEFGDESWKMGVGRCELEFGIKKLEFKSIK